jgi:peptidoglycan/LPS O-acetylase OafA/YrhL
MPLIVLATVISAVYVTFRMAFMHLDGDFDHLVLATGLGLFALPYLNAPAVLGGPQVFPLNGPEYTLFLELAVNVLWFSLRPVAPLAISALIATVGVLVLAAFGSGGDTTATLWLGFPRVAASFFIGVLIFEGLSRWALPKVMGRFFWPLCVLSLVLFYVPASLGFGVTLAWVVVIAPLLVLSGSMVRPAGWLRTLCLWGGAVSYPIYVLQYPIFCWLNGALQIALHARVAVLEVPVIFVAIIGLSALALIAFDQPVRRALTKRGLRLRFGGSAMTEGGIAEGVTNASERIPL